MSLTIHKSTSTPSGYLPSVDGRKVRFTFSTNEYDREGDRILGWQLDNFRKSPVILLSHNYQSLPIGRCPEVSWDGKELSGIVEFASATANPTAEQAFQLVRDGYLRSCSVGALPLDPPKANARGGYDFSRMELLEVSITAVGANASALAKGLAARPAIDVALIKDVAVVIGGFRENRDWMGLERFLKDVANINPAMFAAFAASIEEVYAGSPSKPPVDISLIRDAATVIESYRSAGDFYKLERFMHDVAGANEELFLALTQSIEEVY